MANFNEETRVSENLNTENTSTVMDETVNFEQFDAQFGEESNIQEDEKKSSGSWKAVTIGGISGILLGSTSTILAHDQIENFLHKEKPETDTEDAESENNTTVVNNNNDITTDAPLISTTLNVATTVTEDMSFSEAFAAARAEIGAGGIFVWHGSVYGTFYGTEWNAMSAQEQHQFSQNAISTPHTQTQLAQQPQEPQNPEVPTEPQKPEDPQIAVVQSNNVDLEEYGINAIGVEEGVVAEDGSVCNLAYAEVEGHGAIFIDDQGGANGGGDGKIDSVFIDVNDNGIIDEEDLLAEVDPNAGLTIDVFKDSIAAPANFADQYYADMPDYTNDADVSSLA